MFFLVYLIVEASQGLSDSSDSILTPVSVKILAKDEYKEF